MVVHKKLRNRRLAPVLIKEITRLCNLDGVWQAIYTAGVVLPKPVSTCRYYHRAINWQKLYEIGFSPCPSNSKPAFQVRKYALPDQTTTKGLREMEAKDIDAVHQLLKRYLDKFDLCPEFSREEIEHWLLHKKESTGERVIYTYVVEVSTFVPPPPRPVLTVLCRTTKRRSQTSSPFTLWTRQLSRVRNTLLSMQHMVSITRLSPVLPRRTTSPPRRRDSMP